MTGPVQSSCSDICISGFINTAMSLYSIIVCVCVVPSFRSAYDSVTNAADESLLLPIHWAIANDHYRHVAVLIKK